MIDSDTDSFFRTLLCHFFFNFLAQFAMTFIYINSPKLIYLSGFNFVISFVNVLAHFFFMTFKHKNPLKLIHVSGLLFMLIILTLSASVIGCIEVLASCTVDEFSNIRAYKPAIIFTFISCIFMLDLSMATKGGIHLYYLLTTYYTNSW